MGVTIDSIQIEIESSSTNAAKGIDALAKSLEGLKKNGSFKAVSNNLNNLSTALNNLPNVHRASNSLRTLANSIEQLKGVGSIAGISNSLKKLPDALSSIEKMSLEKTKTQLKGVADALSPLSAIKAGGFGTMVNAMKNLGKVTESLDETTITAFAKKIEILNEKLGPFAEKMSTVKTAFSSINKEARSAASGAKEFDESIDTTTFNLSNFINVARTIVDTIKGFIQTFSEFVHDATQWDGIEYQFGNAFGEQADMYYEKITKISEALSINKQMFMENSAMAASMLIGFGVKAEDAREMGLGYTQLAYDMWAAFNNVYKTLDGADGAMAAVRSAIAGEVEPIRRAGFTIVESQLEQTAANHGLKISIENATEAQKSYLRYLELVDQAHRKGIVGTYASEMDKAEGMLRTLKQQWKSLTQAVASLFIPLLVKIVPYIQAMVELLREGVYWLANLLGIEIQAVDFSDYKKGSSAIEGLGDAAGDTTENLEETIKAAKELKNATLGIDELNVISPTASANGGGSDGSGSGSGGTGFEGFDVGSLWDETIFDTIQSDVDEIKEKLKGWLPIIATVAASLAGLRLAKLLDDINAIEKTKLFKGKVKDFTGWIGAFTSLSKEGGILAALAVAFPKIANAITKIGKAVKAFPGNFGAFISLAKEGGVVNALAAAFPKIANAVSKISSKLGPIGIIIAAVASAIAFLVENWEKMKKVAVDFFNENIAPKFKEIKKHVDKLKETLEPLAPVFEYIGIVVRVLIEIFDVLVKAIGGVIVALVGGGLAGAFNAVVSVIEGFVQWFSGVVQIIAGAIELIVKLFSGDLDGARVACEKIVAGIKDVFVGLYDMTIGPIVEFVKGVIDWFVKMWDELVGHSIVPDTINAIVEWFTSLPSKIFGAVENFVKGIIDKFKNLGSGLSEKFSSAWESVKTWWSKKTDLSSYTPAVGNIASKLSSAWESAKTWWNDKKSALKSYTPSIGSIYEKLKERWDNARTWWNDKKTKAKEYTPSIGSIYEKLSDRWKNAREWWNNKKGSMSYTPSIGSITDKLKSAWNSAKTWWSKNVKLSIPSLSFKVTYSNSGLNVAQKAIVKALDLSGWPKLSFAANGGIFDQGSLIWAGERGPEVMATAAGGKTGVMNVQQMQEAVYEGVYAAMSAAVRGMNGGGSQDVRVYLDGKEISASVKKHQHESGASIMGNEVYSY